MVWIFVVSFQWDDALGWEVVGSVDDEDWVFFSCPEGLGEMFGNEGVVVVVLASWVVAVECWVTRRTMQFDEESWVLLMM